MTIEGRRFLELAVHVKLASEAMSQAAQHLAALRPDSLSDDEADAWTRTMDELMAMNVELGLMERILRAATRAGGPGASRLRKARATRGVLAD